MCLPGIKFNTLNEGVTEKNVAEIMMSHPETNAFLVFLRCKYEHETEWEYLTEACSLYNYDDIIWLNDWHEGQENVEYLGITEITLD